MPADFPDTARPSLPEPSPEALKLGYLLLDYRRRTFVLFRGIWGCPSLFSFSVYIFPSKVGTKSPS